MGCSAPVGSPHARPQLYCYATTAEDGCGLPPRVAVRSARDVDRVRRRARLERLLKEVPAEERAALAYARVALGARRVACIAAPIDVFGDTHAQYHERR